MPSALDLGRHSLFVNNGSLSPSTFCEFLQLLKICGSELRSSVNTNRCHQTSRLNLFISILLICIKTDGTYNFRLSSHVVYDRKNWLYINTCITSLVISVVLSCVIGFYLIKEQGKTPNLVQQKVVYSFFLLWCLEAFKKTKRMTPVVRWMFLIDEVTKPLAYSFIFFFLCGIYFSLYMDDSSWRYYLLLKLLIGFDTNGWLNGL